MESVYLPTVCVCVCVCVCVSVCGCDLMCLRLAMFEHNSIGTQHVVSGSCGCRGEAGSLATLPSFWRRNQCVLLAWLLGQESMCTPCMASGDRYGFLWPTNSSSYY